MTDVFKAPIFFFSPNQPTLCGKQLKNSNSLLPKIGLRKIRETKTQLTLALILNSN